MSAIVRLNILARRQVFRDDEPLCRANNTLPSAPIDRSGTHGA